MSNNARILVVDDNAMNRAVLEELLDGRYETALAEEGSAALALAPSFQPDVVLLDVMMPGRDGFDVCRTMKRHHSLRQTRIIMVSAKAELAARLQGYDAGADDYVTKPFCEEELLTKIEFALRTKRLEGMCGAAGEMLALLSELRDTEIDADMVEVRALADRLANELQNTVYELQINAQFLDDLHHASVLRDVGMLAVPDVIRSKVGRRELDEQEQIKQHTLVGARLLNRLAGEYPTASLFQMAATVARSHHEDFDGRGYPDQLAGNDIPLPARIVRVAEALVQATDATRGDHGAALALVQAGSGSLYDPIVCEALQAASNELMCSTN
jgi:putative two-component system response regulator